MLQLSGQISHKDILDEVQLPTASNSLHQRIRTEGGIRQYLVNITNWKNCNMCSPYLPKDTAPFSIKDWYGYNHTIQSVTDVTLSGDTTLDKNQTVTYTATLIGDVTSNSVITWFKFDDGVITNLGTGLTKTITWSKPAFGYIKLSVYSPCSQTTLIKEFPVTWNCTPITQAVVYGSPTVTYGQYYTYYLIDIIGSQDTDVIVTWEKTGNTFIIHETGRTGNGDWYCTVYANAPSSSGNEGLRAKITSYCTSTEYVTGWQNVVVTNPPNLYYSTYRGATLCKSCPSGTTPSCRFIERAAGLFTSNTSVNDANAARDADMQAEINNDGSLVCSGSGGGNVGNQVQSGYATKNNCPSGEYGSEVTYTVPANTYYASTLQEANQLAINDVNANKQSYANTNGTCTPSGGGGCIPPIAPSLSAISIPSTVYGATIGITANMSQGNNLQYSWSITGGHLSTPLTSTNSIIYLDLIPTNVNNSSYTINLTVSNGCGSISRNITFNVQTYGNETRSGVFYKNNCTQGSGNPYTYTVAAYTYLAFNQNDANNLAQNDVNNNGQAQANLYGTCTYTPPPTTMQFSYSIIKRDLTNNDTYIEITNFNNFSISAIVSLLTIGGGSITKTIIVPSNTTSILTWFEGLIGICGSTNNVIKVFKVSDPTDNFEGYATHQSC